MAGNGRLASKIGGRWDCWEVGLMGGRIAGRWDVDSLKITGRCPPKQV